MMFARSFARVLPFLILVLAISSASSICLADSPGEQATPGPAATSLPSCPVADNVWVLVSSALVLMMTAPGLALFYCGLVRKKNVLSVMMQCVFMMCLMTVVWAIYGYSLVFGGNQRVDRGLELPAHARSQCGVDLRGTASADRWKARRCTR